MKVCIRINTRILFLMTTYRRVLITSTNPRRSDGTLLDGQHGVMLWYYCLSWVFFTILFFLLCLWFTTYTYKHEHVYKSSFAFSFHQSWNSHPPPDWWCWAESWPFSSELHSLEYSINPELPEIFFTPQLSCWSSHGNYLTQWNMAPTNWLWQFCFISGTSWLFNLALSSSHWSRWCLALIFRSFLKFKLFCTRNDLNLSNLWLLNFQLATSIVLHLPKISTFLQEFQNLLEIFCSITIWAHHQWWLQYPCWLWSNYLVKLHWLPIQSRIKFKICTLTYKLLSVNQPVNLRSLITSYVPLHSAHQLSNLRWWLYPWSSHHTIQLYCYHTPFSTRILPVWSQIFHIQILPSHPS